MVFLNDHSNGIFASLSMSHCKQWLDVITWRIECWDFKSFSAFNETNFFFFSSFFLLLLLLLFLSLLLIQFWCALRRQKVLIKGWLGLDRVVKSKLSCSLLLAEEGERKFCNKENVELNFGENWRKKRRRKKWKEKLLKEMMIIVMVMITMEEAKGSFKK